MRQADRLAAAGRLFVFAALLVPVLWTRDTTALLALAGLGLVWTATYLVMLSGRAPLIWSVPVEAVLVGTACGLAGPTSPVVLGALTVPPFCAGLRRGWTGLAVCMPVLLASAGLATLLGPGAPTSAGLAGLATWSVTGLGLGLIAGFVHATWHQQPDPLAAYHAAQGLLRELLDLSGGLSSGLDPAALAGQVLGGVRDELPTTLVTLSVPREGRLVPLVGAAADGQDSGPGSGSGGQEAAARLEALAAESWRLEEPLVLGQEFAFPLTTRAGSTGVVSGRLSGELDGARLGLLDRLQRLTTELRPTAVHLDTALLFAAFRDAATAEERRRLAREMHDGVAQDIASLGYLVDSLAARPASPEQAERLELLRSRISAVVSEVRRSVVLLRTTVGASESLGAALGSLARGLSETSAVPIQVSLDERTARLLPEVEAELFRIAQEALNNAIRHAGASAIRVHCQVDAPAAVLTIADDGRGLQPAKADSNGLEIMRERARLVGAELTVEQPAGGGTVVTVRHPATAVAVPAPRPVSLAEAGS